MKKFLAILFVVIGLAAITYAGWYFYNQKGDSESVNDRSQSPKSAQSNDSNQDPSENGEYLVIKEWGVRLPLPDQLKGDLEYGVAVVKNPEAGYDNEVIYISSKKLATLNEACGLSEQNDNYQTGSFGGKYAISRTKNQTDLNGNTIPITDGEYWYSVEKSSASCASSPEDKEILAYEQFLGAQINSSNMFSRLEKYQ